MKQLPEHSEMSGEPGRPGRGRKPQQGEPKGGPQGMPPSRSLFGIVSLAIMGVLLFMMFNTSGRGAKVNLEQFVTYAQNAQLEEGSVVIHSNSVVARTSVTTPDGRPPGPIYVPFNSATRDNTVKTVAEVTKNKYKAEEDSLAPTLLMFLGLPLLMIMLVWFLISRGLRSAGGAGGVLGNFGKSRHRTLNKEMTGVTFSDVAGIDEAKDEVQEIIEFLKNPKKFTKLGGRIPRGVLLVGEPGCGKTLLAKAIAGEADVPFFSISGSDFVEMFVGVGASRVRDLFKQAKDSAPCIIFLDEIDAVGRRRGSGFSSGGHDEREQTLNAILVEMDGFAPADGVIVIAATNRADVLDPALVRPGRFDRQVVVPLPDLKGRLEILRVHAKKVKLADDVDLEKVARGTATFSGADLAAIINEAAIGATMANKDAIEHTDLEEARDKIKFGRSKRSRLREKDENRLVAYHEAGHAVLQVLLKDCDPLHKVTIIPRGNFGGATFSLPSKDRTGYAQRWLAATIRMACGGRLAEERVSGDVTSGAQQDIMQVTNIARAMVMEWGMSPRLGFVRYAPVDSKESYLGERDFSNETARLIDEEVRRIVDEAYADARRTLDEHWPQVEAVAEALLKYETLSAEEVERLMRGEAISKPSASDQIRAEERRRNLQQVVEQLDKTQTDLPPGASPATA
ncbi:MAG: ATP-dependent zinc metalloprotease FtsH [Phycisphaerales bacterium]|nr:ATP-dependent zinc metalloprotease FtsH [Phycisphaerales bacterium]